MNSGFVILLIYVGTPLLILGAYFLFMHFFLKKPAEKKEHDCTKNFYYISGTQERAANAEKGGIWNE